jgi:hypothetical protein
MAKRRRKHTRTPVDPKTLGGQLLLAWLDRTGHSQSWLAERVRGVAQRTVSRWIDGVVPQVDDAVAIRDLTGVPVEAWAKAPEAHRKAS